MLADLSWPAVKMAELFVKYNCTNCQDDIPGTRVHCAECASFDLCLQCFASGAEIGTHRNDHQYQFVDTGTGILSIFRGKNSWSALEELRLLDAIEMYGFGNWEDISKHIETRSAEDAKEEYISKYLNGTIGRNTWTSALENQRPHLVDHTVDEDQGPLGASHVQKLPPLDVTPEEAAQLGYMPHRDGFEREYDPTAEKLVSALTLNPNDKDTDLILKLAQVDIYTRRLRERARRKRLVRDYQLVANFFRGTHKVPHLNREQRDFRDRFRVFAQFYTAYEYERLLASLERERELRIRLSELNRYRWNGLTRIDECVHFEQHAAVAPYKNTGPYGHGKTDNQTTGSRHGSYLHLLPNKKIEIGNVNETSSNSIGPSPMHRIGDQLYSDGSLLNKSSSDNYRGSSGQSNQLTMTPTTMQTNYQAHQQTQQQQQQQQQQLPNVLGSVKREQSDQIYNVNQQNRNRSSNYQTSVQQLKQLGENLLSSNEMQLCTSLNLPPTRYITLKTVLLSGAPISSSPIENSIRKYLIKAGWLSH